MPSFPMPLRPIWLLTCLLLICAAAARGDEPLPPGPVKLHVTGQIDHAAGTLVRWQLPEEIVPLMKKSPDWVLRTSEPVRELRCQPRITTAGTELLWRLETPLAKGKRIAYQLFPAQPEKAALWTAQDDEAEITIAHRERPLLVYNHQTDLPPAGLSPLYARSGYVHPVYSPAGKVLSDDFPPDHHHQHALFFAWVNTRVQGEKIDFWNQIKGQGTVRHAQTTGLREGPVFAELTAQLEHITHPGQPQETIAIKEDWAILTHQADTWNVWEVQSRQENVLSTDIELSQHHYGGFGFRGARAWSLGSKAKEHAQFLTSSGKNRQTGNHTPAEWVMLHGPIPAALDQPASAENPRAGIVIISHPDNLRSPQQVRLHPEKPYFCFCPVVKESYVLQPGQKLESRYLIVTFDGSITAEQIDQLARNYFHPPTIEFESRGR